MHSVALPYWEARALQWRVMPPLSPGAEDVDFYERCAAELGATGSHNPRALLLGVTAPIATMRWPAATELVALDWAAAMFRLVWPRTGQPAATARVRGDWREMPLAASSRDIAVGDGCFTTFARLDDARLMVGELWRVLRPGGVLAMRSFCRPDAPLDFEPLFADLLSGKMRNLGLFRWLLAMAVHGETTEGVSLHAVWRTWNAHVPDPAQYRKQLGWESEGIESLERWRDLDSRYIFPSREELYALVSPHFEVIASETPGYEWGQLFPRMLMRRRD